MKDSYSAKELSEILGISVRSVQRKAGGKTPWAYREEPNVNGGGTQKLYLYASLPKDVRGKIDAHQLKITMAEVGVACVWPNPMADGGVAPNRGEVGNVIEIVNGANGANGKNGANGGNGNGAAGVPAVISTPGKPVVIPERSAQIGLAKYRLVHAWRDMVASQPWGKKEEATQIFLTAYQSGELLPGVYHLIKAVNDKTLYRLDKKLRLANDDYHFLCDGRGGWKVHGTTKWRERTLPQPAQTALLRCYLLPNQPSFTLAHRAALAVLKSQGITANDVPGEASWRRWYDDWSRLHHDLVVLGREGEKAYIDQCAPFITRDTGNLQVGQVLVADGHDLNFEILHPETGRPCRMKLILFFDWASRMPVGWQIMPTESTTAIHAALRNAIVALGKIPTVVYLDNGRAFKARIFTDTEPDLEELRGVYSRLGIATIFAEPYRARSKVVERFFLTFGMQCEELVPSYCGGSIDEKPAWRSRNEKFHQAWHEARTQGWVPNIREAAHLIALYFRWYGEQPHEGLGKRLPLDVLTAGLGPGVDAAELNRDFLWRVPVTPRRCRARLYGIDYESDCLHGLRPEKGAVIAHVDMADLSRIHCYLPGGKYLGEALPVQALPPIARILGDEIGVDQVKSAIKRQRTLAKEAKSRLIELGVTTEQASAVTAMPWQQRVSVLPGGKSDAADKAGGPAGASSAPELPELPEKEVRRLELVVSRAEEEMKAAETALGEEAPDRPVYFPSSVQRYEWAFRARFEHGYRLSEADDAFLAYYEKEPEFENYRQRFADLRELFAMYSSDGSGREK